MKKFFYNVFVHNIGYKLLAIGMAFALWFVNQIFLIIG